MKALTVQQPWAWAIVAGHKPIENRKQVWAHRGRLAIHAGTRWSERGGRSPLVLAAAETTLGQYANREDFTLGAIIGVVDVLDTHWAHEGCCDSSWAESSYVEQGGKVVVQVSHLVLGNPIELPHPVPCRGWLGLWNLPADVEDDVLDGLGMAA